MLISDLEQVIDDVFNQEEGVVKSVDTVYESSKDGYKLVISIHGLVLDFYFKFNIYQYKSRYLL